MDLSEWKGTPRHRHPWEAARVGFFLRLALRAVPGEAAVRCLDVGSGDAWLARQLLARLPSGSRVVGWDHALDKEAIQSFSAHAPAGFELTASPPDGRFDLLLCLDVLEHIEEDRNFLTGLLVRYLDSGGRLLCSVPAWPALYSRHDAALGHVRRYTPASGAALLRESGLDLLASGGLFHSLLPVRWGQTLIWKKEKDAPTAADMGIGGWNHPRSVTWLIRNILEAEGRFSAFAASRGWQVPGLTWWALCVKR